MGEASFELRQGKLGRRNLKGVILRGHKGDVRASFRTYKPTAMEPASA